MTDEKKKKAMWKKEGSLGIITFPDGANHSFDFSKLDDEVFAFYGKKQYLGDAVAGVAQDEKLPKMREIYDEILASGVELTAEGRIRVLGRTRSNERNDDVKAIAQANTPENAKVVLKTHKMGLIKLSAEAVEKITEIANK